MDDKKPAKKANSASKPEFSGRLDSINVSGAGSHFQFELVGKNGSKSYLLDSANPSAFATLGGLRHLRLHGRQENPRARHGKWRGPALCQQHQDRREAKGSQGQAGKTRQGTRD